MDYSDQAKTFFWKQKVDSFMFHCTYEKTLDSKTTNAYKIDLMQFYQFVDSNNYDYDESNIPKEIIRDYLQEISHFKPKTIKRKLISVKAMFNYWESEDNNFTSPFRKLRLKIKEPQILPAVMTITEVQKILTTIYAELGNNTNYESQQYKITVRNLAVIELLFSTGIRVSELSELRINNIDLKTCIIKVYGKGHKERIMQICNSEARHSLRSYYKLYSKSINNCGFFFTNRLGGQLATQSIRSIVHSYVRKSGLSKHITPHTFRHTFATLLLEEDVDIRYIQSMLGHSSIVTTQIYTHINPERQRKILTQKHPRRKLKFSN